MKSFQEIKEEIETLEEKLITLGGKAFPKFGNVVIMSGGAGSGKGFIQKNLLGLQGKTFDVDELKKMALKSKVIQKNVKKDLDIDLKDFDKEGALKDPEVVSKLHDIVGTHMKLNDRKQQALFSSILTADPDRKPNLVFDVTLRSIQKLDSITRSVKELGYDPKKIHIVWVINDVEIAVKQNQERDRTVAAEILFNTHRGAANTMQDIVGMGKNISKYLDGDIVFAFNKVGVDSELVKSGRGGSYLKDAKFFYVKKAGQSIMSMSQIDKDVKAKIKEYTPKNVEWE